MCSMSSAWCTLFSAHKAAQMHTEQRPAFLLGEQDCCCSIVSISFISPLSIFLCVLLGPWNSHSGTFSLPCVARMFASCLSWPIYLTNLGSDVEYYCWLPHPSPQLYLHIPFSFVMLNSQYLSFLSALSLLFHFCSTFHDLTEWSIPGQLATILGKEPLLHCGSLWAKSLASNMCKPLGKEPLQRQSALHCESLWAESPCRGKLTWNVQAFGLTALAEANCLAMCKHLGTEPFK